MKNQPKNQIASDPPKPRRKSRLPQFLRLTGFATGLFVLLGLFALLVVGLPPDLTRRITDRLVEQGIPLRVKSIRLSMHHGWVLDEAALYSTSPDDLQPLLKARKLYVMAWPVDWTNLSTGGWHIRVHVRNLGVSLGRPWESTLPEAHPFRTVSLLDAALNTSPGRIDIETSELHWGNIKLTAHGAAAYTISDHKEESPQGKDFRRRIAKAADALSQLKCWKAPEITLSFNYDEQTPAQNFLDAFLSAEGISWQNRVYERLSGALEYRNDTWTIPALQLNRSSQEQLILSGSINLETGIAQASGANTLSAADLFSLLPPDAQSAVAQTGIKPYGRFDFTASAGPAPVAQLAEKIDIRIQKAQLQRKDITLDPLTLHLERDGNRVRVSEIQTLANGGPLTGDFKLDMESLAWNARIKAQCDPLIASDYDADLKTFLLRFHFPNEMPEIELDLSQDAPEKPVVITGPISANRFYCGGVPIDHLETFLVFSNQVVDLTPIHAVRDHQQFDGSVQVDFTSGVASFNATNTFPPVEVARALAPDFRTVLENIRFDGPVYAAGRGQVDYWNWTNHSFIGTFRAENIGYGKARASLLKSDVTLVGTWMTFTNSSAQLYRGQAEGSASFDISAEDGSAPYRINARLTRIDLTEMLQQVSSGGYNRISGQLSTSFDLSADAAKGFWDTAQGAGRIHIENGHLAEVPLFGGFSRLIQSAFAGFKLFSLTTFSADYTLHDGAIWSDNAQLGGTLLSANGRGSYSPETGLNFIVAAEPFRQTTGENKEWYQLQRWATEAVKEGTAPLFRLLEFQLNGPLDKPEWSFVNLPNDVTGLLRNSKQERGNGTAR